MAKNNAANYGLTLNYPGYEMLEGTLISFGPSGVEFRSRKPGSATQLLQFYPSERVAALVAEKEGGPGQMWVWNNHIPVFRSGKRGKERPIEVTGVAPLGNHLMQARSDEFGIILVKAKLAQFSGEERDENAPKRGKKPKGEGKGKGGKKKTSKGKPAQGEDWT